MIEPETKWDLNGALIWVPFVLPLFPSPISALWVSMSGSEIRCRIRRWKTARKVFCCRAFRAIGFEVPHARVLSHSLNMRNGLLAGAFSPWPGIPG
jgi:hypothetical protein